MKLFPTTSASVLLACLVSLTGCGGDDAQQTLPIATSIAPDNTGAGAAPQNPPKMDYNGTLDIKAEPAPLSLDRSDITFFRDIAYGEHDRHRLDLLLPASRNPTATVVFYHGGGFVGGSKESIYSRKGWPELINYFLNNNIAFVTANYRYVVDPTVKDLRDTLSDGRSALQFIRYHRRQLNIHPDRAILSGGSAGGFLAMHIGLSDDYADPENSDPVQRMSTRVRGVHAFIPQASYDFSSWDETLFPKYESDGLDDQAVYGLVSEILVKVVFGTFDLEQIKTPEFTALRNELSVIEALTPDDPELYLTNDQPGGLPTSYAEIMHHPQHVQALVKRGNSVGRPVKALGTRVGLDTTEGASFEEWVVDAINR